MSAPTLGAVSTVARTPLERALIDALVGAYPVAQTRQQIASKMYALDPDGGPITAENTVSATLTRMRARLAAAGWATTRGGNGRNGHGIKLTPIEMVKNPLTPSIHGGGEQHISSYPHYPLPGA